MMFFRHLSSTAGPHNQARGFSAQVRKIPFDFGRNVAFGALVALGMFLFNSTIFLRNPEQAGGDFISRLFVEQHGGANGSLHKVVVVDLAAGRNVSPARAEKFESVSELTRVLHVIRNSGPAAILLDVDIDSTVPISEQKKLQKELTDQRHDASVSVLERAAADHPEDPRLQGNFSLQPSWFDEDTSPSVLPAISALGVAADGVVRTMLDSVCAMPPAGGWVRIPTLPYVLSERKTVASRDCPNRGTAEDEHHAHYIVYRARADSIDHPDDSGPISVRRSADIAEPASKTGCPPCGLTGKYVIIGRASSAQTVFPTPVGPMPSVLIQANALLTALDFPGGVRRREQPWLQVSEIAGSGFLMALVPLLGFCIARPLRDAAATIVRQRRQSYMTGDGTNGHPGGLPVQWIKLVIGLAAKLSAFATMLAVVGYLWAHLFFPYAVTALGHGVVLGTFLPVLATALESMIDLGMFIGEFGRKIRTSLVPLTRAQAGSVAGVLLAAVVLTPSAHAASDGPCAQNPPRLYIVQGNLADVFVFGDTPHAQHPTRPKDFPLHEFDTVQIREQPATVEITENGIVKQIQGPNVHYLVPPCSDGRELGLMQQFFAYVLATPLRTIAHSGTTLTRSDLARPIGASDEPSQPDAVMQIKQMDAGKDVAVPSEGPLRPLPALAADEQILFKQRPGLAYAWLGGHPPYIVTVVSGDDSKVFTVQRPVLWVSDWRMRDEDGTIAVQDSSGQTLTTSLTAVSSDDPVADQTARAINLFQTGGDNWHLEAFRELRGLADQNTLAAQAVAAIRLSGAQ